MDSRVGICKDRSTKIVGLGLGLGMALMAVFFLTACSSQTVTGWQDYASQGVTVSEAAALGAPALAYPSPAAGLLTSPLTSPLTQTLAVSAPALGLASAEITVSVTQSEESAQSKSFLPAITTDFVTPTPAPTPAPVPLTATLTLPPPEPTPTLMVAAPAHGVARPIPTTVAGAIPPLDLHTTVNYLLLGTDIRSTEDAWRTDSIMVLGVDTQYRRAALLSIPRDLLVDIPDIGQRRINQVDYFGEKILKTEGGGPALFSQVLSNTLGIKTDHWLRVDMTSFRDFVDIIGGVTVHLDCPYYELSKDDVTQEVTWFSLPAGDVTMDGETAFMFVRLRYLNTDSGRSARQRQFLWALRDQAMSTNLILKIPELWRLFNKSFETDLSLFRLLELGNFGLSLDAENVRAGAITTKDLERYFTSGGADVLRINDPARIQAIIDNIWTAPPLANTADLSTNGTCPPPPKEIPTYLLQEIPLSDQEVPDLSPDWLVAPGTEVVVANTAGRSIRLRTLPALAGEILKAYQAGNLFQILAADEAYPTYPVDQDGYKWVKVGSPDGEIGWIAARYLAPVDPQATVPTPEAAPETATPSPDVTVGPTVQP